MNNNHNPIARIIENLQYRWSQATRKNPDYKLICWSIKPEEATLFSGFYKLESSSYGSLPEFFIVLLTPFEKLENYSGQLISDWIEMWLQDETVKETKSFWDTDSYRRKVSSGIDPDIVLLSMLADFQKKFCEEKQDLVLGLLPRSITNFDEYNYWLIKLAEKLPDRVKLSLTDHLDKGYLIKCCHFFKEKSITIECRDLNLQQVIRQMATSGDSNDPGINFRKCLFEMADGVVAKKEKQVIAWGEKAILIGQKSGLKSLLATAYLVYAGFLLQLKKEKTDELLNKGILIAKSAYKTGDPESTGILLQLYGYKSAYQSICGSKTKACHWMLKQAQLAVENKMGIYAISTCRMSARLAKRAWENDIYIESLRLGYHAGGELSDEELRTSEITILAYYYAKELRSENQIEEANEIDKRMKTVFGNDWSETVPSFSDKHGQTMPDIKETIKNLNINS